MDDGRILINRTTAKLEPVQKQASYCAKMYIKPVNISLNNIFCFCILLHGKTVSMKMSVWDYTENLALSNLNIITSKNIYFI